MEWFFPDGVWKTNIARRQGSLHWSGAYEVYTAADGHGLMVTASLKLAEVLVPWLIEDGAAQDLGDREKYPSVVAMVRDLPYVMKVLREWVESRDGEALFFEGQRRHQPFGVVWNIEEALTKSPQIAARGYLQEREVPGFGAVPFPGRFLKTSADGPHPSPATRTAGVDWPPVNVRPSPGRCSHRVRWRASGSWTSRTCSQGRSARACSATSGRMSSRWARRRAVAAPTRRTIPYYVCWNRNKRSVTINMATEQGRAVARRLAAKSDVIIENFSAGVLKRWGLDRESLAPH